MLKKILTLAAVTVNIILVSCGGGNENSAAETKTADGYVLKFNMQKGTKFDYAMTMDMNMKQKIMNQDVDIKNKMIMGYIFEVTDDSAGWKKVNAQISRIAMDMDAGGTAIHFDSDKPDTAAVENNPGSTMGRVMGALKGGEFGFTINEKGEVSSVYGMKEMMQQMFSKANIPNADQMTSSVGQAFDEENFRQNIQQSFNVYPDKPVKTGESWVKTFSVKTGGMDMKMNNTYTLESVNGEDAKITVASKISSGADSLNTPGVKIDMNGSMTGNTSYDLPTGLPKKGDADMKITMKVNGQGMEVPMDISIKMLFEGKKL